jgi:hypothetical protein
MDKFLDAHHQPKLSQEIINHLNRPITRKEIEAAIKSFPTKRSPAPNRFTAKFYQPFKEELIPILLKLYQEIKREGTLLNSLCEASITLIPNTNKDATKKRIIHQYL